LKPGQGAVYIFCEHLSPATNQPAIQNRSTYVKWNEIPFDAGATIWQNDSRLHTLAHLPEVSEPPPRGGKNVFDGFGQSWLDLLFVAATLTAAGCTNDVETINFLQVVAETL